ncbi:MAG: hypothetical protein AABM30_03110 [Actinomycetota bacterium]
MSYSDDILPAVQRAEANAPRNPSYGYLFSDANGVIGSWLPPDPVAAHIVMLSDPDEIERYRSELEAGRLPGSR